MLPWIVSGALLLIAMYLYNQLTSEQAKVEGGKQKARELDELANTWQEKLKKKNSNIEKLQEEHNALQAKYKSNKQKLQDLRSEYDEYKSRAEDLKITGSDHVHSFPTRRSSDLDRKSVV